MCDLSKKVDDDFRELTLDFKHYATLLRGMVDASQVNPKDTDAVTQALELVRLSAIKHDLHKPVVGNAKLASSTCILQASA